MIDKLIKQTQKNKKMMGIKLDLPLTIKNSTLYFDLVRVNQFEEIANGHPSEIELFAMGRHLPVAFYKSPDLEDGFKGSFTTELTNKELLSFIIAMKYNKFEMSMDGGYNRFPVSSDYDAKTNEVADSLQNANAKHDPEVRKLLLEEITRFVVEEFSEYKVDEVDYQHDDKILCKIDNKYATKTSFRHEAIVPPNNPLMEGQPFDPYITKYYYTYYGQLYELETEVIPSKKENNFIWEIKGLEPGKVYPGLTFAYGDSPLAPSDALFGTTLDEDGKLPNLDEAELGKPLEGEKGHPMWEKEVIMQFVEKHIIKKTCEIIIKKHHEDEYKDEFLAMSRVKNFFDKYEWIPFTLDELEE